MSAIAKKILSTASIGKPFTAADLHRLHPEVCLETFGAALTTMTRSGLLIKPKSGVYYSPDAATPSAECVKDCTRSIRKESAIGQVLKWALHGRPFTIGDVQTKFPDVAYGTAANAISSLVDKGVLRKDGWGIFILSKSAPIDPSDVTSPYTSTVGTSFTPEEIRQVRRPNILHHLSHGECNLPELEARLRLLPEAIQGLLDELLPIGAVAETQGGTYRLSGLLRHFEMPPQIFSKAA